MANVKIGPSLSIRLTQSAVCRKLLIDYNESTIDFTNVRYLDRILGTILVWGDSDFTYNENPC